ncbi:uncharacterized protein SAPINGB_P004536 [Magnusiomyces paraingens]|uniref:Mediator of RNA polymerase II transcription subunit 21 n=1 Tax=Magnusiomyces paraingens TaxID=2606893 RepID=A0A5E8C0I3_9ASCO|nr:uncharacterized protein SAPINGB_P004536 [Saprochaete ingens]VVT55317.1 unnamed protein product [Saprochaete ingens]
MSDRLTQLQVCVDQLLKQYYSALNYINNSNGFEPLGSEPPASDPQVNSVPKEKFREDLTELARDIVLKSKQIDLLIDNLPGADSSEDDQMVRLRELENELESVENERQQVLVESSILLAKCDDLIIKVASDISEIQRS